MTKLVEHRGILKAVVYRIYSSVITIIISYLLTRNLATSLGIGLVDSFIKIISYFYFDKVWSYLFAFKPKPSVIWLTGLSGSGKTTIANLLIKKFNEKGMPCVKLDGDEIRHAIKQFGFDEASRKKHNLNVGQIASLLEKQGNMVIVSLISPYEDVRNEVRAMCNNFIEVYVSTDLQTCIKRDVKGLYEKAIKGELKEFTGISAPYYPPKNPEITIDTAQLSIHESVEKIFKFLTRKK